MNTGLLLNGNGSHAAVQEYDLFVSKPYRETEQRIMRQLMESLLYERLVSYTEEADAEGSADAAKDTGVKEAGDSGDYVRTWNAADHAAGWRLFTVHAATSERGAVRYTCRGKRKLSFGRIRLDIASLQRWEGSDGGRPARLSELLDEVVRPIAASGRMAVFEEEVTQTWLKDTQARYASAARAVPAAELEYDELEAAILEGHPYHPCYKSRIGFSLADNAAYGPEFSPVVKPLWVAVHEEDCQAGYSSSIRYADFIRAELGADVLAQFAFVLEAAGRDASRYLLVPVHPWQWRESTLRTFHARMAEGRLVVLGEGADDYWPQQSIRTLSNASSPLKSYVKLPMVLVNTSTSRILAKHTVLNAPLISDWLARLTEEDRAGDGAGYVLLREVAGIAYDHEALPEPLRERAYGTLGAIWRESLHHYLRAGERAVPFNGLCHIQHDGLPLIEPWIKKYGAEPWTEALLKASVTPLIHLLYAHGVALEAHAQNMVLIHREGHPARVAFKDFHDGIRFSRAALTAPELCPALHRLPPEHAAVNPNSFIETDSTEAVRDFVHDAFFFINLSELCFLLEERYEMPEDRFWEMTACLIHEYQQEHPEHEARFRAFDLFAETIRVEQLTARRVLGDSAVRLQQVSNPLYRFR
ncbi:IucA/IucC family protein [Paenibacillus puerhi]|uniref:IucA/IucC family protein n=1 Tax=Paenibacillus puerhi TaxID=2692622 RepID=UPI00135AE6C7|nr:IucA/IucC family protein [Paenibacillus puerhi]